MIVRALFNKDGFPIAFYPEDMWPSGFPSETIQISKEQWQEFLDNQGLRKWINGKIVNYTPPTPEPEPVITYKGDVWRRVTEDQANQLDTEIQKLGVRERNLWSDSIHLDHSDPFFIMLREEMIGQWGQSETDRILAPSEG